LSRCRNLVQNNPGRSCATNIYGGNRSSNQLTSRRNDIGISGGAFHRFRYINRASTMTGSGQTRPSQLAPKPTFVRFTPLATIRPLSSFVRKVPEANGREQARCRSALLRLSRTGCVRRLRVLSERQALPKSPVRLAVNRRSLPDPANAPGAGANGTAIWSDDANHFR